MVFFSDNMVPTDRGPSINHPAIKVLDFGSTYAASDVDREIWKVLSCRI